MAQNSILDFLQGASNSAASNVSAPIDGLNWLLRKAGMPVSEKPFLGSDWMAEKGLTVQPQNKLAGLLGESVGGVLPIVAAAKAPQIAKGLLQAESNAMAPRTLHPQAGAINVQALHDSFPNVDFSLGQTGNKATLSKIVVPKDQRNSGVGSEFMQSLTRAADADGATLALTPASDFGGSKARLTDFYKRFGFVPNKGRNKDFTISEAMFREALK